MIEFWLFVILIAKFNLNKNISLCSRITTRQMATDHQLHGPQVLRAAAINVQVAHVIMRFQCITIYRQLNHQIIIIITITVHDPNITQQAQRLPCP